MSNWCTSSSGMSCSNLALLTPETAAFLLEVLFTGKLQLEGSSTLGDPCSGQISIPSWWSSKTGRFYTILTLTFKKTVRIFLGLPGFLLHCLPFIPSQQSQKKIMFSFWRTHQMRCIWGLPCLSLHLSFKGLSVLSLDLVTTYRESTDPRMNSLCTVSFNYLVALIAALAASPMTFSWTTPWALNNSNIWRMEHLKTKKYIFNNSGH